MDSQMHTIGKAIRPLFADPVTNVSVEMHNFFALAIKPVTYTFVWGVSQSVFTESKICGDQQELQNQPTHASSIIVTEAKGHVQYNNSCEYIDKLKF